MMGFRVFMIIMGRFKLGNVNVRSRGSPILF